MFTKFIVIIISWWVYASQIIMLYTLNLYNYISVKLEETM